MSHKFIKHCIEDSKQSSYSQTLMDISKSNHSLNIKVQLLEGLREQLLLKIKDINRLNSYLTNQYKHQKNQELLWSEIDNLETKILDYKNESITLQLNIQDLQEETQEIDKLIIEKQKILSEVIDGVSLVSSRCSNTKFHSRDDQQQDSTTQS